MLMIYFFSLLNFEEKPCGKHLESFEIRHCDSVHATKMCQKAAYDARYSSGQNYGTNNYFLSRLLHILVSSS